MNPLRQIAPAKINLTLSVGRKRSDGLHEISSLVVFADLADMITMIPDGEGLEVSGAFADEVPDGIDNLALKALRFYGGKARICLEKNIPPQAGLGGGSADAAAVLRTLIESSARPAATITAETFLALGADVPACFLSRPLFMSGAGERVEPLPSLPPLWCVLIKPDIRISTADIFALWDKKGKSTPHERPGDFKTAEDLFSFCAHHKNDLQPLVPATERILSLLNETAPGISGMSGSGSACFGLYASAEKAQKAEKHIRARSIFWVWSGKIRPPPA